MSGRSIPATRAIRPHGSGLVLIRRPGRRIDRLTAPAVARRSHLSGLAIPSPRHPFVRSSAAAVVCSPPGTAPASRVGAPVMARCERLGRPDRAQARAGKPDASRLCPIMPLSGSLPRDERGAGGRAERKRNDFRGPSRFAVRGTTIGLSRRCVRCDGRAPWLCAGGRLAQDAAAGTPRPARIGTATGAAHASSPLAVTNCSGASAQPPGQNPPSRACAPARFRQG